MADLFSEALQEAQWGTPPIPFPVTNLETSFTFDIAEHKRADRDGALVESTGRNPRRFSFQIPCVNNITPGKGESWKQPLYPVQYRLLLVAFSDRSTQIFQHPSQGIVKCKVASVKSTLDGGRRDGEVISVELIEYFEEVGSADLQFADVKNSDGITAGANLDAQFALVANSTAFDPDAGVPTFEESMRAVAGIADNIGLLSMKVFGVLNRVLYRLDAIEFAVTSARDATMWQLRQAVIRLRDTALTLKANALAGKSDVSLYVTPGPTTVGNLASKLSNTTGQLVQLNPSLVQQPSVPFGTLVRYYK